MLERLPFLIVIAVLVAGAAIIGSRFLSSSAPRAVVDVRVPVLSPMALKGQAAYEENCALCHGTNAAGGETGPPFVHDIYNPGHHSDASFLSAAQRGVPRHHWSFGDMPPQPQMTENQMLAIIRYVRELQVANGILFKPHNM